MRLNGACNDNKYALYVFCDYNNSNNVTENSNCIYVASLNHYEYTANTALQGCYGYGITNTNEEQEEDDAFTQSFVYTHTHMYKPKYGLFFLSLLCFGLYFGLFVF